MSAITKSYAPIQTTDAMFRAIGKMVSDQMLAGGWVKTADTGQIDWTTVTAPGAFNTERGYEVWKSTDGGSGGLVDIYVRIGYGSGNSGDRPRYIFKVGFGSDGAGNLTGAALSSVFDFYFNATDTEPYNSNLSVGSNWICMVFFTEFSQCCFFSLERLVDSSGNPTNELLIIYQTAASSSVNCQVLSPSVVYANQAALQLNLNFANAFNGGELGVSLVFGQKAGATNPSSNIFGITPALFGAAGGQAVIPNYGENRNYIFNGTTPYFNSANGSKVLSRFD